MKKMPRIFDLVVMSHEMDAPLYRVKEIGNKAIGVIDIATEATQDQVVLWLRLSDVSLPTYAQLARIS